jgi:cell division protein FtsL
LSRLGKSRISRLEIFVGGVSPESKGSGFRVVSDGKSAGSAGIIMTEYHTIKRIDNSRLSRPAAPARLRDFRRRLAVGAGIAALLLTYAWQHFECIQLRYNIEQLDAERTQAAELNQQLHLEVATLRSPMRVDAIARNQLGLTAPVPGQVAPADASSDAVVAEARAMTETTRP